MTARWPTRRVLAAAASLLVLTTGLTLLGGAAWAAGAREPRVTLLGAGGAVSVLVTAGDARLLIAVGDDPVAFANALDRARPLMHRRVDVLLLAGRGETLNVPASVVTDKHVRHVAAIGFLPEAFRRREAGGSALPVIVTSQRIRLPDGVTVEIDVAGTAAREGDEPEVAWRASIRRGDTAVAVLSDGRHASTFRWLDPLAALVLAGGNPADALAAVPVPALAISADRIEGRELRQEIGPSLSAPIRVTRVHPGEAAHLAFVADGLRLPAETTEPVGPTPVAS